jgi:hypothetical protein
MASGWLTPAQSERKDYGAIIVDARARAMARYRKRTSSPDRTLGSNHVDFGGMTAPASAIAMSSQTEVG